MILLMPHLYDSLDAAPLTPGTLADAVCGGVLVE